MRIKPKVAIITGAASGIGFALAKHCLERGMMLVLADNAKTLLEEAVASLYAQHSDASILSMICDVANYEEVEQLAKQAFNHFGRIDWVINNAGISGPLAPLWMIKPEQINRVLDVNMHGVLNGVQAFLPYLFEQSFRSHIINMASVFGLCSSAYLSAYAMSKAAIISFSESLYFELSHFEKPVDVSVVCPSFTDTALLQHSLDRSVSSLHQSMVNLMTRSKSPQDVALHILKEIDKKTFYILPDREVKGYCEERVSAIIEQNSPHQHALTKLISKISKLEAVG